MKYDKTILESQFGDWVNLTEAKTQFKSDAEVIDIENEPPKPELKYKLTTTRKKSLKNTWVYQIEALKDIPEIDIKKGNKGGYIENEKCLSQSGNCWIWNKAEVFGNSIVIENAQVKNNAMVYNGSIVKGNAQVTKNAIVSESSDISGDAEVTDDAKVKMSIIYDSATICGFANLDNCEIGGDVTIDGWANLKGITQKQNYI
jgi:hypothetical protein